MQIIAKLVSPALALLWGLCVLLRCVPGALARWERTHRARLPRSHPRGLEWRSIKRLPAGRVVAWRLQVVIA